jgi:hypothetical protein
MSDNDNLIVCPACNVILAKLDNEWIPVDVRLPEDCVRVLICTDQGHVCEASHHKRAAQWQTPDGMFYHTDTYQYVTHWRPLPEPPTA